MPAFESACGADMLKPCRGGLFGTPWETRQPGVCAIIESVCLASCVQMLYMPQAGTCAIVYMCGWKVCTQGSALVWLAYRQPQRRGRSMHSVHDGIGVGKIVSSCRARHIKHSGPKPASCTAKNNFARGNECTGVFKRAGQTVLDCGKNAATHADGAHVL